MDDLKSFVKIMELPYKERSQYLSDNYSSLQKCLSSLEIQAIFSSLYDSIIYDYDFENGLVKKQSDYDRLGRKFWHLNHALISNGIDRTIIESGRIPDISHIQKASKLNGKTIQKHLDDFEHIEFMNLERKKMRLATYSYLHCLYKQAFQGDIKAGALLLKHVNEYSKINIGNKINAKCIISIEEF